MPQNIFDWALEKYEKTGIKIWKNKEIIKKIDQIINELIKILKNPIGSSEPFYKKI